MNTQEKGFLRVLITLPLADTEASTLSKGGLSVIAISHHAWVPERNEFVAAIKTEYLAEGTLLFSAALAGLCRDSRKCEYFQPRARLSNCFLGLTLRFVVRYQLRCI